MTIEDCRSFYAQEVRFAANIGLPSLIDAFARVPREKYLGPGPWQLGSPEHRMLAAAGLGGPAYLSTSDPRDLCHNVVVVLDLARDINNGQPSALARWIDALHLKTGDRVYHLGCGVGYYTAIIAEMVGPGGSVAASEVDPQLAERAKENLSHYPNVSVFAGDGAAFDPGTCDAMLINAGVTHPHSLWLERLHDNGRLMLPLTMATSPVLGQGIMIKIVREHGGFSAQMVTMVAIFSCTTVRDPQLEPLLGKALRRGTLMKLKSVRQDAHDELDTCLVHGHGVCISSEEPIHVGRS